MVLLTPLSLDCVGVLISQVNLSPSCSTVHQEDQEGRQEGLRVRDRGEVRPPVLHRDLHHRLRHSLQDTGEAWSIVLPPHH